MSMKESKAVAKESSRRRNVVALWSSSTGNPQWRAFKRHPGPSTVQLENETPESSVAITVPNYDFLCQCVVPTGRYIGKQPDEDTVNEWISESTMDFVNEIYVFYANAIHENPDWEEACNGPHEGFPMGVYFRMKTKDGMMQVPANKWVDSAFLQMDSMLTNQTMFPEDMDEPWPPQLKLYVAKIFKYIFRIYAIMFANRCLFEKIGVNPLIVALKKFLYFTWYHHLLKLHHERLKIDEIVNICWRDFNKDMKALRPKKKKEKSLI